MHPTFVKNAVFLPNIRFFPKTDPTNLIHQWDLHDLQRLQKNTSDHENKQIPLKKCLISSQSQLLLKIDPGQIGAPAT